METGVMCSNQCLLWGNRRVSGQGCLPTLGALRALDLAFCQGAAGELCRACSCAWLPGHRAAAPAPGLGTF